MVNSEKTLHITGPGMRVAFVHDWLVTYRGGERVLESLLKLYPEAPIFTLFYDPNAMPESIRERQVITPRGLAPFTRLRKALLPLLPAAMESLPLNDFDLIISSSSCVAKGVIPAPYAKHLCYLHSPMRYIWDLRDEYLAPTAKIPFANGLIHLFSSKLRVWDAASSHRVNQFIVNSRFIGERVRRYYGRNDAQVIHPPIELERFFAARQRPRLIDEPYFLTAGAMVGYKRFDLAIKACERLGRRLVVAGSGPLRHQLGKLAATQTTIVDSPDNDHWDSLIAHADAFLFCGIEDFGMTAIEAMAAGTPVIAAKAGGACDFIDPGVNGEFFQPHSLDSLIQVLDAFVPQNYPPVPIDHLRGLYSEERFHAEIRQAIANLE